MSHSFGTGKIHRAMETCNCSRAADDFESPILLRIFFVEYCELDEWRIQNRTALNVTNCLYSSTQHQPEAHQACCRLLYASWNANESKQTWRWGDDVIQRTESWTLISRTPFRHDNGKTYEILHSIRTHALRNVFPSRRQNETQKTVLWQTHSVETEIR